MLVVYLAVMHERSTSAFFYNQRHFTRFVHAGVKGVARDVSGSPLDGVSISVIGRDDHDVRTTQHGDYWRLLLPGSYQIQVHCFFLNKYVLSVHWCIVNSTDCAHAYT